MHNFYTDLHELFVNSWVEHTGYIPVNLWTFAEFMKNGKISHYFIIINLYQNFPGKIPTYIL